jgi:hypothetical protein
MLTLKTTGGTASHLFKANGTVDSNVYLTGVTKASWFNKCRYK